ncbi:hypothetical protein BJ973_000741 [Actinoplanes tereljensis]|uniref:hypothetical protein n=1 Tax=Paractinoplanes tereljensis TaxID=571912 RepID=UPI001940A00B|nr:hypothetical protein [Actinoplanes tereljensis]
MPYLLGVDIGSGTARTALCRRASDPAGWGPPEPVPSDVLPAVSGLFRRCGDEVPVFSEELFVTPQALLVEQARGAADAVWVREEEGPDRIALAYPTTWGPGRVGLLRAALDDVNMSNAVLVTRARAVVERHRATGRHTAEGRVVAVCRIGGLGTEVSLVIPGEPGRLELLTSAEDSEIGGDDLAEGGPAECRAAMAAILDLFRRTAQAAGVTLGDLAAVLLAGGGTTRPIVAEALAETIAAPVIRDDDPRHTIACGAAVALRPPTETSPAGRPPTPAPPTRPIAQMSTTLTSPAPTPATLEPAAATPTAMTPSILTAAGLTPAGPTPAGLRPAALTSAGLVSAGLIPAAQRPAGLTPAASRPDTSTPAVSTAAALMSAVAAPAAPGPGDVVAGPGLPPPRPSLDIAGPQVQRR